MPQVNEIGGSIQDFLSQVRAAFEAQFPPKRRADGMIDSRIWVRDIFEDYVIVNDEEAGQMFKISMTKSPAGITFDPRTKWQKVKLTYTNEMVGDSVITEFKGKPPEVPVRAGVNVTDLTKGDDNPFFLTVEISTEGRVSKNGLLHDAELATTLVQQINTQAAEGIMGHIKEGDRSTAYPISDVHWLGATRHGKVTWAKGYIPKTAVAQREHFRILMATNGRAATSITGPAVREFVDKQKGVWRATNFQLEQLDLAPFTRAALPPESDFMITREMYQLQEPEMDKAQFLAELTASEVPQTVREAITKDLRTTVAELEKKNAELELDIAEFQKKAFEATLDTKVQEYTNWTVKNKEAEEVVKKFRKLARNTFMLAIGDERDPGKVTELISASWEDDLKVLAEQTVAKLSGPAAIVTSKVRSGEQWRDDLAAKAGELRKERGI